MTSIGALKNKLLNNKYLTLTTGSMLPVEEALKIFVSPKILTSRVDLPAGAIARTSLLARKVKAELAGAKPQR